MKKPVKKPAKSKQATAKKTPKKGKFKKIGLRILLGVFLIACILPVAHYLVFPQQTRCILIDYSSFKKEGFVYYNEATTDEKLDSVHQLIQTATAQMAQFWGAKTCEPKFIVCNDAAEFAKYGSKNPVPAVTVMKWGAYIVLSTDGLDVNIISHELSHAELYHRIGFYAQEFKIPTWFSEGLAMQCDHRAIYSEDAWITKTGNLKTLRDVKQLKSPGDFFAGTHDEVMLNFMAAKHEVKNWYTQEKLKGFIELLKEGANFEEAYAAKVPD